MTRPRQGWPWWSLEGDFVSPESSGSWHAATSETMHALYTHKHTTSLP